MRQKERGQGLLDWGHRTETADCVHGGRRLQVTGCRLHLASGVWRLSCSGGRDGCILTCGDCGKRWTAWWARVLVQGTYGRPAREGKGTHRALFICTMAPVAHMSAPEAPNDLTRSRSNDELRAPERPPSQLKHAEGFRLLPKGPSLPRTSLANFEGPTASDISRLQPLASTSLTARGVAVMQGSPIT